jgi:hypothetical protein
MIRGISAERAETCTSVDVREEDFLIWQFQKMKAAFVDKGVPVTIGEWSASYRASLPPAELQKHIRARNYFSRTLRKKISDRQRFWRQRIH